ncbi:efflux RND transporter permease subunit [Dyadobacter sediminis]|uniref:Patched family protein n=1 Tax=Dyadobacter sediminis TaxID=1493691 RepID=A0A5R9KKS1_9BACT|nr:MMPL family transporter [Dyadobacter sediminis]TLU96729.1 patched family protein [Dyadobacter sediminis]GGB84691.1 transporter [Dyadobacter sediminis]
MWNKIATYIIRYRLLWVALVLVSTIFMAYEASKIELSYQFARILPSSDPVEKEYQDFRKLFGEDGSVMVIGWQDPQLFEINKFRDWCKLSQEIKETQGIKNVLSLANVYKIVRNDSLQQFDFSPVIRQIPSTQQEVDSLKKEIANLPIYEGLVLNSKSNATLIVVTFNDKELNSKRRLTIVSDIEAMAEKFAEKYNTDLHYSGMPYIRTVNMKKISGEMKLFMGLAVFVTLLILWAFFRSLRLTLLSIVVVLIGVIFSVGILHLFDYKITALTGLLPPLLIVIGVPNCVFLINKYQSELKAHNDKDEALLEMIRQIGLSTFLANMTTAIGFGVFYFTNSILLVEFGVVAAISVMVTYVLCLLLIPITLHYMSTPKPRHLKHLEGKWASGFLKKIDFLVHNRRKQIYMAMVLLIIISAIGMTKIKTIGYVVDDLPKKDVVYTDLRFFEKNFNGVLPFEVMINTKKPNGVFADQAQTLYKIKAFQNEMAKMPEFSKPISVVEASRFLYQAYRGGDARYFALPGVLELNKLTNYVQGKQNASKQLNTFLNEDKSITRVSFQMADVGSERIKELMQKIRPKVDSIFSPEQYKVSLTGHSLVFLKSNDYLLSNLYESLLIAILLIAIVGMVLFRSIPIILLSKLPCLIPLALTAGIMGYFGIYFKPTTILIFSITFGIASDGTVYFLTRYRQELYNNGLTPSQAVTQSIFGTGLSMIYTAVILFSGFIIFAASSFGGTAAMGVMVSITLLVAMCTNLILLPALLLSIAKRQGKNVNPS